MHLSFTCTMTISIKDGVNQALKRTTKHGKVALFIDVYFKVSNDKDKQGENLKFLRASIQI